MSKLPVYFKAIAAAVLAGLGSLEVASTDNHFTAKELITTAIVTLGALAGTYAVPNAPKPEADAAYQPWTPVE